MDTDFACNLLMMSVMARGITAVLEEEGSESCAQGWTAYNQVCAAMGWLRETLEEAAATALKEV